VPFRRWNDALNDTAMLYARVIQAEEFSIWKKFLESEPPQAVDWAFQDWQRNGRFFPRPHDILELIAAFKVKIDPPKRERYEHHGEGYGEQDIKLLWRLQKEKRTAVNRPLTDAEIDGLLNELDRRRGASPAWRKSA
jgi:hypothetical protein